jgi:ricin-type beta-trefoil lectin protein
MNRQGVLAVVSVAVGLLLIPSSLRADTIIQSADSGLALVPDPDNIDKDGCELMLYQISDDNPDGRPKQRWVFVKTKNGFLLKSAESGLALVPVAATRKKERGKVRLEKVEGEGEEYQRWNLVKTKHGYLIQNVETGLSLVPIRKMVGKEGGELVLFPVEKESREGRPDQNWKLVVLEP